MSDNIKAKAVTRDEDNPESNVNDVDGQKISSKVISTCASGRSWRINRSGRKPAGKRVAVKSLHTSWEEKQKDRLVKQLLKQKERNMKEEELDKRRKIGLIRKERKKKAIEKEMKLSKGHGQIISNIQKLKKMSKRDLKLLRKMPITQ